MCKSSGDVGSAVAAVMKQAVERISRMREAALRHLRTLLAAPLVRSHVPAASALEACLPSEVRGGTHTAVVGYLQ